MNMACCISLLQAFAKEGNSTYINEQGVKSKYLSIVNKNLKTARENVFLGDDGFYHLKPGFKDLLSKEEYEFFEKSNEKNNSLIKEGVIQQSSCCQFLLR